MWGAKLYSSLSVKYMHAPNLEHARFNPHYVSNFRWSEWLKNSNEASYVVMLDSFLGQKFESQEVRATTFKWKSK
jgi:hypothetical protein